MGTDERDEGIPLSERDRRIDALIADIDARLTRQLAAILERTHPLERPWRSLSLLVDRIQANDNIEVVLLDCTMEELASEGLPIERTGLFRLLHEPLHNEQRGAPYAAVLADYSFGNSAKDIVTLRDIGQCAANAFVPFIAGAAAELVDGAADFAHVDVARLSREAAGVPGELDPTFDRFEALREDPGARFLVLTMPRIVLRQAMPFETLPVYGLAWLPLATRFVESFVRYRWCPNIIGTDVEAGGLVKGMRAEIDFDEPAEWTLATRGFTALSNLGDPGLSIFRSATTLAKPKYFGESRDGKDAEVNSRLGHTMLPYLMIVCRIAHYCIAVYRDCLWQTVSRVDAERELNHWLNEYTADRSVVDSATCARRVLRSTQVMVHDTGDDDAWRRLELMVRPHFKYLGAFFSLAGIVRVPKPPSQKDAAC